jgi:predicted MFS family arabinose efflux permease
MTPRRARIIVAIASAVITAAVATGIALGGAIVNRLPQTWSFTIPFVVAVLGLLVFFSWLQKRL